MDLGALRLKCKNKTSPRNTVVQKEDVDPQKLNTVESFIRRCNERHFFYDEYSELFGNRLPNFNEDFFEPLFRRYTNWGGGTQEDTAFRGLYFDSGYELFIYAFFWD